MNCPECGYEYGHSLMCETGLKRSMKADSIIIKDRILRPFRKLRDWIEHE